MGASGISEKSLDLLTLATREPKVPGLGHRHLRKHIRDLFQFEHYQLQGIEVERAVQSRAQRLVEPRTPSAAQAEPIQATGSYAAEHGVT